jgi:hypothetical protein
MRQRIIYSTLLTILLTSCAPQFLMPPLPRMNSESRQRSIEVQLKEECKDDEKYIPLGYGPCELIKSQNYKRLDSLYRLEAQGNITNKLKKDIEKQREITFAEKINFSFQEDHLYGIQKRNTVKIYEVRITTDTEYIIIENKKLTHYKLNKDEFDLYASFELEQSFLNSGNRASNDEIVLIQRFKNANIPEDQKDEFRLHTIDIMALSKKLKSCSADVLLKHIITEDAKKNFNQEIISSGFDEPQAIMDDKNNILYFSTIYSLTYKKDDLEYTKNVAYELDPYFRISKKGQF